MQFTKKTSKDKIAILVKLLIKVVLLFFVLFFVFILFNKIDFPAPTKKIEKIIPNEEFKTIK